MGTLSYDLTVLIDNIEVTVLCLLKNGSKYCLPDLRSAGSRVSTLLVAAMTCGRKVVEMHVHYNTTEYDGRH